MNITPYGWALRTIRKDLKIRLYEIAKTLGVSSPYLSSVEMGHKNLCFKLHMKILNSYKFTPEQIAELDKAFINTTNGVKVEFTENNLINKYLLALAKSFHKKD